MNLDFLFVQEKCTEGIVTQLAMPTLCRFTMFPSLKQRPTLVLEQDTLSSFSLSLSLSFPFHLSPYWFHLISLKGFWATGFQKKVTMAFFWHTASPLQLRIWRFHDHDGHLIKHIVVYVRRVHMCVSVSAMDMLCQPQLNAQTLVGDAGWSQNHGVQHFPPIPARS